MGSEQFEPHIGYPNSRIHVPVGVVPLGSVALRLKRLSFSPSLALMLWLRDFFAVGRHSHRTESCDVLPKELTSYAADYAEVCA